MGFPFPYRQWLQASSALVRKNVVGLDCPFIDGKAFLSNTTPFSRRLRSPCGGSCAFSCGGAG